MEGGKRSGKSTTSQGTATSEEEHKLWSPRIWVRVSALPQYQLCLRAAHTSYSVK